MCDPPLFILGSPRSGTTLLRLLLASHQDILVPPECGYILWNAPAFADWSIRDAKNPARVDELVRAILSSKKMDTWGLDQHLLKENIIRFGSSYQRVCDAVIAAYAHKTGKTYKFWGDKNNYYIHYINEIASLFPDARFIHIVRDGRDVACSYREVMELESASSFKPDLPTEAGEIAEQWHKNVSTVEASLSAMIKPKNTFRVRYEDIVTDCLPQMQGLCQWLAVDFDPNMLSFHKKNMEQGLEPSQTMDWKKRTLGPVSADTLGRYSRLLSPEEIQCFNQIAKESLCRFDYL
ncbi:MAG: sulfotransferase [Verrucomicrobiae bacterium]|nr:sulfotransferase [Verrucomicrobiae bacterium]NNJ43710.1 sulfotransferase [Akkermansiaceae bacterium]